MPKATKIGRKGSKKKEKRKGGREYFVLRIVHFNRIVSVLFVSILYQKENVSGKNSNGHWWKSTGNAWRRAWHGLFPRALLPSKGDHTKTLRSLHMHLHGVCVSWCIMWSVSLRGRGTERGSKREQRGRNRESSHLLLHSHKDPQQWQWVEVKAGNQNTNQVSSVGDTFSYPSKHHCLPGFAHRAHRCSNKGHNCVNWYFNC